MLPTQDNPPATSDLKTALIIRAALIMGIFTFLGILFILNQKTTVVSDSAEINPILTYTATGYGILTFVVALILPPILDNGIRNRINRSQSAEENLAKLARGWLTRTIIEGALLEGAALFCLIAYFLEKMPLSIITAGLLVLEMALSLPTINRGRQWIDRQNCEMSA